jgi:hypothetical protein
MASARIAYLFVPAKAGTQNHKARRLSRWVPAWAGTNGRGYVSLSTLGGG